MTYDLVCSYFTTQIPQKEKKHWESQQISFIYLFLLYKIILFWQNNIMIYSLYVEVCYHMIENENILYDEP